MIRIAIVDDHQFVIKGLAALLRYDPDIIVVETYNDGYKLIEDFDRINPDVVLMDVNMPTINGFDTSERLLEINPYTSILMFSMEMKELYISKAHEIGVKGFISKSAEVQDLIKTIKLIYAGDTCFPASA